MYTSCPTSLDTSVRDSKLQRFCGDTISVRTLCMSQVSLMVNMKTTWSCATEREYCAYFLGSCQRVLSAFVDSLYIHAHVLCGAISPHSGSKASLKVRNTMVGYFRNCRQGDRIIESVLFDLVSRPELVPWLQEQIVEQKRIDAETSGTTVLSHSQSPARSKSSDPMPDVQLILPGDARKQRKQTKQIFLEKGESQCVDWASPDTYSLSAMLQRLK